MKLKILSPNSPVSSKTAKLLVLGWAVLAMAWWMIFPPAIIPGPLDVIKAFSNLVQDGLGTEVLSSLWLNIESVLLSTMISLALAYATVLPIARPVVAFVNKMRFLGLTGLTFVFGLYLTGHDLKVGLLTLGMTVFLSTSMVAVVSGIPKEQFDHARTLGMSEWRVVWEVVVLGTIDEAMEVIRQNAAMGFVMLTMVEGLVRSDGGIGALMLNENKHFNLAAVFALQLTILMIGLLQDFGIGWARKLLCPYADLKMERA